MISPVAKQQMHSVFAFSSPAFSDLLKDSRGTWINILYQLFVNKVCNALGKEGWFCNARAESTKLVFCDAETCK